MLGQARYLPDFDRSHEISRRTLVRAAIGGAVALNARGIPAWARPVRRHHHLRQPDSLPFPRLPAGTPSIDQIRHIVVLMMENHSFDNLLGMVPHQVSGRRSVDGLTVHHREVRNFNPDASGARLYANHATSPCQVPKAPSNAWNASHQSWDGGRNDGFVRASGPASMWFWNKRDLPFTYSLVRHFPVGQRYFCSVLGQTYPNRRFFFAATASGAVRDNAYALTTPAANGTIFDRLDAHKIDWRVYAEEIASDMIMPNVRNNPGQAGRSQPIAQFFSDAAVGHLPPFTFIDPNYRTTSEEDPQDVQVGEQFLAQIVHALTHSRNWKHTALFITYDEHGGYYDHVPPPPALEPDSVAPVLAPGDLPGGYDRYGFRVPLIVVSPWARKRYVSSVVQDHTSLTAFIERKWNLPAMTFRDANAHPMTDYFDFRQPAFREPPALHPAPALGPGLDACHAHSLNPPLPE